MTFPSGNDIPSNFVIFHFFRTNVAHLSMQIPCQCHHWISELSEQVTPNHFHSWHTTLIYPWKENASSFPCYLKIDMHFLTFAKLQPTKWGRAQVTKVRVNHSGIFLALYTLHHVKSTLHAFILSERKCLICSLTPIISKHSTIQECGTISYAFL